MVVAKLVLLFVGCLPSVRIVDRGVVATHSVPTTLHTTTLHLASSRAELGLAQQKRVAATLGGALSGAVLASVAWQELRRRMARRAPPRTLGNSRALGLDPLVANLDDPTLEREASDALARLRAGEALDSVPTATREAAVGLAVVEFARSAQSAARVGALRAAVARAQPCSAAAAVRLATVACARGYLGQPSDLEAKERAAGALLLVCGALCVGVQAFDEAAFIRLRFALDEERGSRLRLDCGRRIARAEVARLLPRRPSGAVAAESLRVLARGLRPLPRSLDLSVEELRPALLRAVMPRARLMLEAALAAWVRGSEATDLSRLLPNEARAAADASALGPAAPFELAESAADLCLLCASCGSDEPTVASWVSELAPRLPSVKLTSLARHDFFASYLDACGERLCSADAPAVARVDARPAALARLLGVLRSQSRSVCAGVVSRARERGAPVERLEAAFESLMSQ